MMAESLFKLGKYKEALAAYQQVKNPAGKDFAVLALLHAGQAAAQLKEWDRSLQLSGARGQGILRRATTCRRSSTRKAGPSNSKASSTKRSPCTKA